MYIAPYVDSSGLHIPTYEDILEKMLSDFKSIYGQDVYLGIDSIDYQWISIVALRMYDALQSVQLAYNNRAPGTAVGSGLDQIVKMNGISRKVATYSTCLVTLTGVIGTVITNGIVQDKSGYRWDLPANVVFDEGTKTVTATCQTLGAINALIGDINTIVTPTAGWLSVTNNSPATMGDAIETDGELRARQTLSVTKPSMNLLTGTVSAIASLPSVTRYNIAENYTDYEDIWGNPPHSISCVVEGGTDLEVAQTIWANRGLGCFTNGNLPNNDYKGIAITDPITSIVTYINFFRPTYVPIYVEVNITPMDGYTTITSSLIQETINDYLNSLQIGEPVTVSALYAAAMAVTEDIYKPTFAIEYIHMGKITSPQDDITITMLFDEVAQGILENIIVTVNE